MNYFPDRNPTCATSSAVSINVVRSLENGILYGIRIVTVV